MKTYITSNKPDDYGNNRTELIITTKENAKQYYWYKEVEEPHIEILKKYLGIVEYEEEKERDDEQRFY